MNLSEFLLFPIANPTVSECRCARGHPGSLQNLFHKKLNFHDGRKVKRLQCIFKDKEYRVTGFRVGVCLCVPTDTGSPFPSTSRRKTEP